MRTWKLAKVLVCSSSNDGSENLFTYSAGAAEDDATTGAVIEDEDCLLEESPLRRIVFILETILLKPFFSVVAGASVGGLVAVPGVAMIESNGGRAWSTMKFPV
jgi:hypothetical protein